MSSIVYTIGHSNHEINSFMAILRQHGITAIGDVRSQPYSRWVPQYSQDVFKESLTDSGIAYVFLGKELGARSKNPNCYIQGKVQFDRLATEASFADGIKRVIQGMERYRIALMCAEKDPLDCHRTILVARKLFESGVEVSHIHYDGSVEPHQSIESRLLTLWKLPEGDMFKSREEFLAEAYAMQAEHVAYQDKTMAENEKG
ncbi:hypothetical protein KN63_01085 [Smithella sp. F21]|nr:hypothetical protein KN63_01085 [Smithella sp. F21]HCS77939.1 DUF488 domain-containing protein [Syntrophaceae bacterium]